MSRLLANQNTLQMLQGVEGLNKWEKWVFEKPLAQLDSECEDLWLERLIHTAMAIEEQIEFTESQPYSDIAVQKSEVRLLTNRLRDFIDVIGFVPTIKGIEEPEIFEPKKQLSKISAKNKRPYAQSKLLQVLTIKLKENFDSSIQDVWHYFYDNQGEELYDLIEVISVSDLTSTAAIVNWRDAKTGQIGDSQTRKSMASAMSKIRKTLKN
jgi:hypothetical protein